MSKFEKAKERLRLKPKDYTYTEARSLLSQLGFVEYNKGKTSGSRVKFYRKEDQRIILLHKPHPDDVMNPGAVKDLLEFLMDLGELWVMEKNNTLQYKGYHTKIEFDSEEFVLRGKIEGINDLVNFECTHIKDVEKEFHEAVDDYLEFCKEVGKNPDKEYKGNFNVRISPKLHKKLAVISMQNGDSLNASVEKAIQAYVSEEHTSKAYLQKTITILSETLKTKSTYQFDKTSNGFNSKVIPFSVNSSVKMKYN